MIEIAMNSYTRNSWFKDVSAVGLTGTGTPYRIVVTEFMADEMARVTTLETGLYEVVDLNVNLPHLRPKDLEYVQLTFPVGGSNVRTR